MGPVTTMMVSVTSLSPSIIETLSEISNMPIEEIRNKEWYFQEQIKYDRVQIWYHDW